MQVTEMVNRHSETEVSLWMGMGGMPYGSVSWSTVLTDLGSGDRYNAAIAADPEAVALLDAGTGHIVEILPDRISVLAHGEPPAPTAVGNYVLVDQAQIAPGKLAEATEWAITACGVFQEVTGVASVLTSTVAGAFGELTWYAFHPDAAALQRTIEATVSSELYAKTLMDAGSMFLPGARQVIAQRAM
jgi:hypothetical protein